MGREAYGCQDTDGLGHVQSRTQTSSYTCNNLGENDYSVFCFNDISKDQLYQITSKYLL